VPRAKVMAHRFESSAIRNELVDGVYWRDVGTIDAYWEANLDLTHVTPALNLYDRDWPIFTYQEQLPPAKFVFDDEERRGMAVDSLVSGGCIVSGASVQRSLLFSQVRANSFSKLDETVVLPQVDIGRHARLTKTVVDRGCKIPDHLVVGEDPEEDERRFYRTESGITLVTREMLAKLG
jgi:glucose-1-phosphate adenylyltransferase